jgi:hypothetical protein
VVGEEDSPFEPMDPAQAGRELVFPACKTEFLGRKNIFTRGILPQPIEEITSDSQEMASQTAQSTPIPNTDLAIVQGCTIRIDFANAFIAFQVPYVGWLKHPENQELLEELEDLLPPVPYLAERAPVATFCVDYTPFIQKNGLCVCESQKMKLAAKICSRLGVPEKEVMRVVGVVVDFLKEKRKDD